MNGKELYFFSDITAEILTPEELDFLLDDLQEEVPQS